MIQLLAQLLQYSSFVEHKIKQINVYCHEAVSEYSMVNVHAEPRAIFVALFCIILHRVLEHVSDL